MISIKTITAFACALIFSSLANAISVSNFTDSTYYALDNGANTFSGSIQAGTGTTYDKDTLFFGGGIINSITLEWSVTDINTYTCLDGGGNPVYCNGVTSSTMTLKQSGGCCGSLYTKDSSYTRFYNDPALNPGGGYIIFGNYDDGSAGLIGKYAIETNWGAGGSYNPGVYIDYTISIDASVASPVPVPAAVWLFGSGLAGLIGIAHRKKA